jgi:hypothetical protein
LSVNRISETLINNESPDLAVDSLAYETGKIFYPLFIEIGQDASWKGIRNHKEIVDRWKKLQPEIKRRFSGDESNRYFNRMDQIIASPESLDQIFKDELLIRFYFHTIYVNYAQPFETESIIDFPIGNYGFEIFKVKHQLKKTLNASGFKELIQEGFCIKRPENRYKAEFILDPSTNCIRVVVAEWHFNQPESRKIKLILYPLRLQPTDQETQSRLYSVDKKKGKGFFSSQTDT